MMSSKLFDAPQIDSATIDFYLAKSRRERARALSEMIRAVFSSPEPNSGEVRGLPARERARLAPRAGRVRA